MVLKPFYFISLKMTNAFVTTYSLSKYQYNIYLFGYLLLIDIDIPYTQYIPIH